jgi:hypothetical protein
MLHAITAGRDPWSHFGAGCCACCAGAQERAAGTRRTRPFRAAEISALWGEELLAVCLARWALQAGCTPAELRQHAQQAYAAAVQQQEDAMMRTARAQHEAGSSTQRSHSRAQENTPQSAAVLELEQLWQQSPDSLTPAGSLEDDSAVPAAGACPSLDQLQPAVNADCQEHSIQGYTAAAHAVSAAAAAGVHVCIVSSWPQATTEHILASCKVPYTGWLTTRRELAAGLYVMRDDAHLSLLLNHKDWRLQDSKKPTMQCYVAGTAGRAVQVAACTGMPDDVQGSSKPACDVYLADWVVQASSVAAVRAQTAHVQGLQLIDDTGFADLLAVTSSRLVMDGVLWK